MGCIYLEIHLRPNWTGIAEKSCPSISGASGWNQKGVCEWDLLLTSISNISEFLYAVEDMCPGLGERFSGSFWTGQGNSWQGHCFRTVYGCLHLFGQEDFVTCCIWYFRWRLQPYFQNGPWLDLIPQKRWCWLYDFWFCLTLSFSSPAESCW